MENMPTIVLTPLHIAVANTQPLQIAFNAHGLGHYDAVFWASPEPQQLSQKSTSPQQPTCSCGRKSIKGTPCSLQLNVYTTRCPCYNLQSGCNHKCRCKNCQNPYGKWLAQAEKPATSNRYHFWLRTSCKNKHWHFSTVERSLQKRLVVVTTEWLPWLQEAVVYFGMGGYLHKQSESRSYLTTDNPQNSCKSLQKK